MPPISAASVDSFLAKLATLFSAETSKKQTGGVWSVAVTREYGFPGPLTADVEGRVITFRTGPTLGHEADAGLNPGAWTVATGSSPGYMATVALPGNTDASQVKPIIHAGAPLTIAFDLAPVGW